MYNNTSSSYARSFSYENLMRQMFRQGRDYSRGIDNAVFLLLDHISNGHYGTKKDYPRQVLKIRKYLGKGIDKVLKWKLTEPERRSVLAYASQIGGANDEDALSNAIEGLLIITRRFQG